MTAKKLDNQTAFDKVYKHLTRDDFTKSINFDGRCVYAGPNNNSCAIGCLLPRELGKKLNRLDAGNWNRIVQNKKSSCAIEATKLLSKVEDGLLEDLQLAHDTLPGTSAWLPPEFLKKELESIARSWKLKVPKK